MLEVEEMPTDGLLPYAHNAKIHTDGQVSQIANSISEFGFNDPVAVWDGPAGTEIVEGHGRVLAAQRLGMETVPVIRLDHMTDGQRRAYTHVHNQLTMATGWNFGELDADLAQLSEFDFGEFGFDVGEAEALSEEGAGGDAADGAPDEGRASLADRFGVPPFSVLNAREGAWADRKRQWLDIGIRSELGRGANPAGAPLPLNRERLTYNIDAAARRYRA